LLNNVSKIGWQRFENNEECEAWESLVAFSSQWGRGIMNEEVTGRGRAGVGKNDMCLPRWLTGACIPVHAEYTNFAKNSKILREVFQ